MSATASANECAGRVALPGTLVWFEVPAENIQRAQQFYRSLFGWDFTRLPGGKEYWHMNTHSGGGSPDGGMMQKQCPQHTITNYINVASVDASLARVAELGGKVVVPRTEVPGMGAFGICTDTENNTFGLWETTPQA